MRAGYLGGTRGYQSAVYRPGTGWTSNHRRLHLGLQPSASRRSRRMRVSPLAVARRRRPGLLTKAVIVSGVILVAALLTVVLAGMAQL
jgi:hypothetical protein